MGDEYLYSSLGPGPKESRGSESCGAAARVAGRMSGMEDFYHDNKEYGLAFAEVNLAAPAASRKDGEGEG